MPRDAEPPNPARGPRAALAQRLELYERAVQQPIAEVEFVHRAYRHHRANGATLPATPATLREDFAGTASVAAAWVVSHPQREAIAVERHGPTLRWAQRRHADLDGLHLVHADVLDFHGPRVDAIASLNFSTFIWHDRAALLRYLRHARRCLRDGGVFVMDAFGGPDAMRPTTQVRRSDGFAYVWEQRAFNPVTARIDCRIHFELPAETAWAAGANFRGGGGSPMRSATTGGCGRRQNWSRPSPSRVSPGRPSGPTTARAGTARRKSCLPSRRG